MLTKRIIPCLDIKNGRTVKGVNFVDLIDAGNPVELAKKFDRIIGMKEGKIICDSPPQAFAWELFEKHNSDKRSLPQIG